MFQLSLVDHIRLSFGSAASGYRSHAAIAERLAARGSVARVATATILGLSVVACLVALGGSRSWHYAAIALALLGLIVYTIVGSLDYDARAFAHRACSAQLWIVCEKYRALLAEVHDNLVEMPEVTRRRDALAREVQMIYEHARPADRDAYHVAREALGTGDSGASDQDIDRFLPASLRSAGARS